MIALKIQLMIVRGIEPILEPVWFYGCEAQHNGRKNREAAAIGDGLLWVKYPEVVIPGHF